MKITRQWLLHSARDEAEKYFELKTMTCIIPRETAWYAISLLESAVEADQALANRILESIMVTDGTHSPCTLFVIYQRYQDRLSEKAKENIRHNLRQNLPISAMVRFSDGNVNHPIAAFVHLICSGEQFGEKAYVEIGKRSLLQFQQIISTRRHKHHLQAEMSEYNSPTYTALTLWFLALAAEFAQDSEAREIALFLEQRLWLNVAMHWHQPSQQFVGPFSRAYAEDSIGGFSALHCTFGYALQHDIYIASELAIKYAHPSALIENAFVAILNFHVPKQAELIAFEKSFPYYFRMTTYCEQYHENAKLLQHERSISTSDDEVYPGGWGDLTSYLTTEYCLGTASRPYVNAGHSDAFSLRYRRADEIKSLKDFRGAYTRMVFNGAVVGQDNFCHTAGFPVTRDYLYEEGRAFTFQHKNKAIVGYAPKRPGHAAVTEIRLDIIFSYEAPFAGIYVDGEPVMDFPIEFPAIKHIIISDYQTLLAFLPLPPTLLGEFPGLNRIWITNKHLIISFYNYQGASLDFSREQMSQSRNGFACIVESHVNFFDVQDFLKYLATISLEENILPPFIRNIKFQVGADQMTFKIDPVSERIIERSWNGNNASVYHLEVEDGTATDGEFCPVTLYGNYDKVKNY